MAKDKKDKGPPTSETPFQKFERLARKVVNAPKPDKRGRPPKPKAHTT